MRFKEIYPEDYFNQAKWKHFWQKHQTYRSICLKCKSIEIYKEKETIGTRKYSNDRDKPHFGAVYLSSASQDILGFWYTSAQDSLFGKNGRSRKMTSIDISDDEQEDSVRFKWKSYNCASKSSKNIAVLWLRTARAKLQREVTGWSETSTKRRRSRRPHFMYS